MNIKELNQEVRLLRSAVIGMIAEDREGEYDPAYVRRVLSMRTDRATTVFKNAASFLKAIESA